MVKDKYLKLNLQHFAESGEGSGEGTEPGKGNPNNTTEPGSNPEDKPGKGEETFTQSELDSQISKAVDSALKKQESKLEKQKQEELDKAKAEAAEYAKMTQKEKEDAERQKREEELNKRERELNDKELLSQIEFDLKENGLPDAFAPSLLSIQDNEKIKEGITDIKKQFDSAVNDKVKEALRQETPPNGGKNIGGKTIPSVKSIAEENRII